ncbi:hypothetical protein [Mesorhizobium sp. LNJC391B00]|uniref:hypothetical protein n=1 Tax=Mesorhizobium sp. LNJC391B00 TaxID=1287273 RepID=UPI0003CEAE56|nr:hypothetical protein [Mesorhizobium sp. LNJC391B00]ESY17006.1 hypothetical protein X749_31450 [Mesorhizobium sp. LNJC391B00]
MTGDLDHWQKRLERHFATLEGARREQNLPVFAFEHGLEHSELTHISTLLNERLRDGGRLSDHWLVWVVYAAEQGYDYDGDEYWTTFESRSPYWTLRADRRSLRGWFLKFHKIYNGLKPTGPWAEWFSIIAWPITHALLPKDLQYQLARALYALRYQIAARVNESPAEIGRYIARASYDTSSRFRNFLEQEEIAGRIVLALLGGRSDEVQQSIHPPTLARIVGDLQRTRNAREWLHDTRRVVDSVKLKGAARSDTHSPSAQKVGLQPAKSQSLPIRPSLVLRRTATEEWTAVLELPSLRDVAELTPDLSQFLRRTRCSIAGSVGLLPAGWLLAGQQRRVLSSWPRTDRPIVQFDHANAALDHLLQSDGRITSGPLWVFRIGSDGLAHEIVGRLVRPGNSYILVSRTLPPALSLSQPTSIKCEGVVAQRLTLPDHLTTKQIAELKSVWLSVAQTVRIWPAGLGARNWDGEGFTEWLEGERPCFGLNHDHPVSGFEVQINGGPSANVPAAAPGEAVFIKLPPLPIGKHSLLVRSKQDPGATGIIDQPLIEGRVTLVVRTPRPWVSGTTGHAGLVATLEPPEPSLDQFWEGDTKLQVVGPAGHRINIGVELMDGAGNKLATEQVADLSLPMSDDSWRRASDAFSLKESDPWGYLAASSGNLVIESDELGSYRIPLHREIAPLRWACHKNNRGTILRLIDDYEGDHPLSVRFHSFSRPAVEVPIEPARIKTDFIPTTPGGLFVASYPNQRQSLVVSMPKVDGGFAGLLIEPSIDNLPRGEGAVNPLLRLLERWATARLVGPLAFERRERVLQKLKQHLVSIFCGPGWATAEADYLRSPRNGGDLTRLSSRIGGRSAFALNLNREAVLLRGMPSSDRLAEFTKLAMRYGLANSNACKAALELWEGIEAGLTWDGATVNRYVAEIREHPEVVRGARLLSLARPGRRILPDMTCGGK